VAVSADRLDPDAPAAVTVRQVLLRHADEVARHLAAVGKQEVVDPDELHDLRVALRRARTVVGHAKGALPARMRDETRHVLRDLAACTGGARDLDVLLDDWGSLVEVLPADHGPALDRIHGHLAVRRDAATEEARRALADRSAAAWIDRWRASLEGLPAGKPGKPRTGPMVAQRVARARRRVMRHGRAVSPSSPDEDVHELRKDVKSLRYLLESYRGLFDKDALKRCTAALRALQDELGWHQDAASQRLFFVWLAADLRDDEAAVTALDLLREDADRRLAEHRAAVLERFGAYNRRRSRRLVDALLDPLR